MLFHSFGGYISKSFVLINSDNISNEGVTLKRLCYYKLEKFKQINKNQKNSHIGYYSTIKSA